MKRLLMALKTVLSASRLIALGLVFSGLSSRPVTAAEFFLMPETNQLYMLGETTFGDFYAFKEFVERDKVQTVVLSGPGGNLDEAFDIADYIKSAKLKTSIVANRTCESACAFIFLSGVQRSMSEGSKIGLHLPFLPLGSSFDPVIRDYVVQEYCKEVTSTGKEVTQFGPCLTQTYGQAFSDARRIIGIFEASGVDPTALGHLMNTSPEDMFYFDLGMAQATNIVGDDDLYLSRDEALESISELQSRLAEALLAILTAEDETAEMMTDRDRQVALLAQANKELSAEQALSAESQRQATLLNEQVVELRFKIELLESILESSAEKHEEEINSLIYRLNTAVFRLAREEQRSKALSAESQRQVTLLNEQVVELRHQIAILEEFLDIADPEEQLAAALLDQQAEALLETIDILAAQLNTALARAASVER